MLDSPAMLDQSPAMLIVERGEEIGGAHAVHKDFSRVARLGGRDVQDRHVERVLVEGRLVLGLRDVDLGELEGRLRSRLLDLVLRVRTQPAVRARVESHPRRNGSRRAHTLIVGKKPLVVGLLVVGLY